MIAFAIFLVKMIRKSLFRPIKESAGMTNQRQYKLVCKVMRKRLYHLISRDWGTNQIAGKALFTRVVYTKYNYQFLALLLFSLFEKCQQFLPFSTCFKVLPSNLPGLTTACPYCSWWQMWWQLHTIVRRLWLLPNYKLPKQTWCRWNLQMEHQCAQWKNCEAEFCWLWFGWPVSRELSSGECCNSWANAQWQWWSDWAMREQDSTPSVFLWWKVDSAICHHKRYKLPTKRVQCNLWGHSCRFR